MTDPNLEHGLDLAAANAVWHKVLEENKLPVFDRFKYQHEMMLGGWHDTEWQTEESIRAAAEKFVLEQGEKYSWWAERRDEMGLTTETLSHGFNFQTKESLANDIAIEVEQRDYRETRDADETLTELYKTQILRLELSAIRRRRLRKVQDIKPTLTDERELEDLERLLKANKRRLAWENSDRISPPPELEQIWHVDGLTGVYGVDDFDFPVHVEQSDVGDLRGHVEGLGFVIQSLVTTVVALAEWSQQQSRHVRQANAELRDLIEQRTTTSLLNARNAWLYHKASSSRDSYEMIRKSMNAIASDRGWKTIGTAEGVRKAVLKYCDDAGIARPNRR